MDPILHIIAGAVVGFVVGLTGVGGGSLMTPILLGFGYAPHIAVGTDLLYAAITKSNGIIAHLQARNINWRILATMMSASLPSSLLTIIVLKNFFGDPEQYRGILVGGLGIMLIITALVILFKGKIATEHEQPSETTAKIQAHKFVWTFIMGLVLGVFVTLTSVGAGAFGTAVLMVLFPRMPVIKVIGTDLAHAVPLTLVAGLGHMALGHVDYELLLFLLVGSIPAIWVGTKLGKHLPNQIMQPLLATMLMIIGVKYAFFS